MLYGRLRPYLRKFLAPSFDGVCSTEILVLRPDDGVTVTGWILGLVQTNEFERAAAITSGSKMPRANWDVLKQVRVFVPELDEQQRVVTLLAAADAEIKHLTDLEDSYRALKRGLMQRLLSGEIEIPEHLVAAATTDGTNDDS